MAMNTNVENLDWLHIKSVRHQNWKDTQLFTPIVDDKRCCFTIYEIPGVESR